MNQIKNKEEELAIKELYLEADKLHSEGKELLKKSPKLTKRIKNLAEKADKLKADLQAE